MSRPALQALGLFDNSLMYEDRAIHQMIRRLLHSLVDEGVTLSSLDKASLKLLAELVCGASEAVSQALANAPSHHRELESIRADLSLLRDEIEVLQYHQVQNH